MTHPLVKIHTADSAMETALLKSRLEAEGIPVLVAQESGATVYGFNVGPMAHADILVPEPYVEEAKAIIQDSNSKTQDSNLNLES